MANVAGAGGGGFWAKPTKATAKPPPRGGKPVTFPGPHTGHGIADDVGSALHVLIHGTGGQTAQQYAAAHHTHVSGGPLFTPLSLGLDQLLHAPKIVGNAHRLAIDIAHPSRQHPPSLKQNAEGLLSGAFGVPFAAVGKDGEVVPPRVPKGKSTPETAGELGQQVREGLRGASAARKEQDKLYSAERGRRAGAASQAMDEVGGQAGYQAALGKLKGELPKLEFKGFANFDQDGIDALFTHIQQHPELRPYDKISAQRALLNVLNGRVPTRSELTLMSRVFGKEVSGRIAASVPFMNKARHFGAELWNVPRSLMSSFDLSAPFRQGLVAGVKYPRKFFANFGPMVKAFGSENAYKALMEEIAARPTFPAMQKAGLSLTDLGPLEEREEQFVSNLAEKIPVAGRGVRASGRAYTGFLSKMRADIFDHLVESAGKQGLDVNDENLLKSIARYANSATGRGSLGAFQKHAVTLNSVFFSPRLLASRLNFMNPVYYARLDPFVRKEALKAALSLVSTVGLTLYLAKLNGASVNADPRNADFAKMRFGHTRIDILGGFQQPVRLLAQLASGRIVSSTTGKELRLTGSGIGKLSRRDIALRFLEQKLAPSPSLINDWFKGTDFADKPFSWKKAAVQRMIPLLAQDAYSLYQDTGSLALGVGGYALGTFGLGIQTYGPKPQSGSTGGSSGSSGGGSSSFWGGGSSGGGTSSFWGP